MAAESSPPLSRATSPGLAGAGSSPSCRRSSAASTASLASSAAAPSKPGGKPGARGPWGAAAPAAPTADAPMRRPTARLLHRLLAASAQAEQQRHDAHFGSVRVELVPPTRHWLEEEQGAGDAARQLDESPAVALRRKLAAAQEQSARAAAQRSAGQVVIEPFEPSVLSRPEEAEARLAAERAAREREAEARRAAKADDAESSGAAQIRDFEASFRARQTALSAALDAVADAGALDGCAAQVAGLHELVASASSFLPVAIRETSSGAVRDLEARLKAERER